MSDLTEASAQPSPDAKKFTPKRVSIQIKHLFFMQFFFNVVVVVALFMLLGNQNQTYRHITQTNAGTKWQLSTEQNRLVQEQQDINNRQEDILKILKEKKEEKRK